MIFKVRQVVSHPAVPNKLEKVFHVIGSNLAHAVSMIRASDGMKRQLLKKHWATHIDRNGRTLFIEILEELKS